MKEVLVFILLIILTISDIKKREISIAIVSIFSIPAIACIFFDTNKDLLGVIGGVLIGATLLVFSYVSRESIGYGDGLVFIVTGLYLGGNRNLELLLISIFAASIFGLTLFIITKDIKRSIPFIPFVLFSFVFSKISGVLL